jgi:hypothetical protein
MNTTTAPTAVLSPSAVVVETYGGAKARALRVLLSGNDGPVTAFVVMARAVRLARAAGPFDGVDDPIANALDEALAAIGDEPLPSNEMPHGYGD